MGEKILVAADPFATGLKEAVVAHLCECGYETIDLGATESSPDKPYFESAADVCRAIQAGEAKRAILFCGTGMGMSIVANRFKGITAAVVESLFAAKMARAINDANVLCLGQMIWGEWMAKEAVDLFLKTRFTEGLESLEGFLHQAKAQIEKL